MICKETTWQFNICYYILYTLLGCDILSSLMIFVQLLKQVSSRTVRKTVTVNNGKLVVVLFQLFASNVEGKSSPSEVLVCTTSPDRPGPPTRPVIKGPITSHGFSVKWGKRVHFVIVELFWVIINSNKIM